MCTKFFMVFGRNSIMTYSFPFMSGESPDKGDDGLDRSGLRRGPTSKHRLTKRGIIIFWSITYGYCYCFHQTLTVHFVFQVVP